MKDADKIWAVARRLKSFTTRQAAEESGVNKVDTAMLLLGFRDFGVLAGGSAAYDPEVAWTLCRDVGPLAPTVKLLAFRHDPNSGVLVPYDDQVTRELANVKAKAPWMRAAAM